MLHKAFEKIDELKVDGDRFPFSKNDNYDKKGKSYFKLMQADSHELPFEDDQFDTVVDSLTLQSCYDQETVFEEMKRVCKPGGRILVIGRG